MNENVHFAGSSPIHYASMAMRMLEGTPIGAAVTALMQTSGAESEFEMAAGGSLPR